MQFKSLTNIETSFRHIRLFVLVFICLCAIVTGFVVWNSYTFAEAQRQKIYVLDNGKSLMLALSQDMAQNRPVEAREHVRRFHELFFTLSPDKNAIESNVKRSLFLAFAGSMYLIFAPSGEDETKREEIGGFNADIPQPAGDGIIADKQKAYEEEQMNRKQQEKMKSLQDFGFTLGEEDAARENLNLIPEEDPQPSKGGGTSYRSGNASINYSANAYRNINEQLGNFYESPKEDEEKEELKRQVAELSAQLENRNNPSTELGDQMAMLEKSYELAAKYMNGGQPGQGNTAMAQVTPTAPITQKAQATLVQALRENTVSGLQQPMSDAEFIQAYSQPRNYGFNTAVGSGYAIGKNTIAACIHQDQTLTDGQTVKLRLLEPLQAGNIVVPKNTLVSATAKVQGERLDVQVSSIEYAGNIIPVELAVFDSDGQKGLSVPSSMEQEAFNEAMANRSEERRVGKEC